MVKVSNPFVLVATVLFVGLFAVLVAPSGAAFGFSFPFGTIVAGPGLGAAGPSTFDTYYNDATMANAGTTADAAANGYGFSPVPGVLPCIPFGPGGLANAATGAGLGEDSTLATSFTTAGGLAGFPGLGAAHFTGTFPEFCLNLF